MKLTIPANTTATVYVPAMSLDTVTESGRAVTNVAGVKFLRQENSWTVLETGSGTYQFTSE
jgi:alpha-L-rhamnosidase